MVVEIIVAAAIVKFGIGMIFLYQLIMMGFSFVICTDTQDTVKDSLNSMIFHCTLGDLSEKLERY